MLKNQSANLYQGLKVIDITNNIAGPVLAAFFSDYGAEVVHVERPVYGDDSRAWIPMLDGQSLACGRYNHGKKSLVVDLKDPRGTEIIRQMAASADLFIEASRPGMMARMGIGYEDLEKINPRLIYCSVSAYGKKGPYSQRGGYDVIAQAVSGIMDITGQQDGPPTLIGTELGDYVASLCGFGAINAALYHRERTGQGQHVDISLVKGLAWLAARLTPREMPIHITRKGSHSAGLCPYGIYNGNNGEFIVIACPSATLWTKLCQLMGRPELADHPEYRTNGSRLKRLSSVVEIVETWLKSLPGIEEAERQMMAAGIPCTRVFNNLDIINDPHFNQAGWIVDYPTADSVTTLESLPVIGNPFEFSSFSPTYDKFEALGNSNQELLTRLGYAKEAVDALQKEWEERYQKN